MTHYFEKTIVDVKTIYTDYLINSIVSTFYHGFKQIYRDAVDMEIDYIAGEKVNPQIKNPGVLKIFQYYLMGLDKWSDSMTENETQRIRNESGCADIFDDLVKAVIKSHIIVLTYTASKKTCKIVLEKLHEKIEPKFFIHSCYLECSRIFVDHPTLFYHDFSNLELKENERKIYQLIKIGIKNGIKRVLPMRKILTEYLNNDYIENDENPEHEYMKIKDFINRDKYGFQDDDENNGHGMNDEGGRMKLLESSDTSLGNNFAELEQGFDDLETLIYGRKLDDTIDVEIVENNIHVVQPDIPIINENNDIDQIVSNLIDDEHIEPIVKKMTDSNTNIHNNKSPKEEECKEKECKDEEENEIENLFGPISKKGKKNVKSVLSDALNAVKDEDEINIVKNPILKNLTDKNDNFFNDMVDI